MSFITKHLRRTIVYLAIACLCIALLWVAMKYRTHSPPLPEASYSVPRQIRYSFTLQNTTNRLLHKADFWTYAPLQQTSTQRCVHLEASHPYQVIADDLGNQILHFTFSNLPPYATKVVTIKADLQLADKPNPSRLANPKRFLRAEKFVQSEDPEVCRLAGQFEGSNPLKVAENTFQWVADHVKYTGYSPNERGALYALRNKEGDCTEFMYLFVALCRANGIPARGIGGYVCSENTIFKPNGYHNWATFYQDGAWRIADPQRKTFMQDQSHYIAMRVVGEAPKNPMGKFHRFRFAGDGLKVKMNI